MRNFVINIFFFVVIYCSALFAQETPSANAVCTFTDGNQISVRYHQPLVAKEELPMGKPWTPGGVRMDLFTETTLNISSTTISPGAYALYFIPGKDTWTMVVNKDVTAGAAYDSSKDLAHANMQTEKLENAEKQLVIYFGHTAPKQCMMRVDYGKVRAVGEIDEK